jgi:hypothetical protein
MNYDELTKEEVEVSVLLKNKSRMEIDEILGGMTNG